jgi:hypothetical protein
VVAGDREDRAVVAPERLVELVVVVLALSEVLDDISEMEEKRAAAAAARHVVGKRVGHACLRSDQPRVDAPVSPTA